MLTVESRSFFSGDFKNFSFYSRRRRMPHAWRHMQISMHILFLRKTNVIRTPCLIYWGAKDRCIKNYTISTSVFFLWLVLLLLFPESRNSFKFRIEESIMMKIHHNVQVVLQYKFWYLDWNIHFIASLIRLSFGKSYL